MQTVKIKLKEPIQFGSEQIKELEMRKPRAKDFRNLPSEANTGHLLDMAGGLCGQPPSVMDELGMEDMIAVLGAVENFMPAGQRTGKKR